MVTNVMFLLNKIVTFTFEFLQGINEGAIEMLSSKTTRPTERVFKTTHEPLKQTKPQKKRINTEKKRDEQDMGPLTRRTKREMLGCLTGQTKSRSWNWIIYKDTEEVGTN